jgi:hypothetical protein
MVAKQWIKIMLTLEFIQKRSVNGNFFRERIRTPCKANVTSKNAVFWDVTPCDSFYNRRIATVIRAEIINELGKT